MGSQAADNGTITRMHVLFGYQIRKDQISGTIYNIMYPFPLKDNEVN